MDRTEGMGQHKYKQNTTYTLNTKENKTDLANKTNYTLVWYGFHDL